MKKTLLYMTLLLASAAGFTSCDDDWATPPMVYPDASQYEAKVNTTIADLKTAYYNSAAKSYDVVGLDANGDSIYIKGRILTSTEAGNVYKAFYVEDETAAIQVRINSSSVYQLYQYGQEVIINCTGLGIGNYGGLLQLGGPENNGTPGYIDEETYQAQVHASGMAEPAKVETTDVTIAELRTILNSADETLLWQCRRVRVADVKFRGAGYLTFADKGTTYSTSRYFGNDEGSVILYNSPYSTFADDILPRGTGSVTGVLSYYNGSWQMIINSPDDLEGFEKVATPEDIPDVEPAGEGTLAEPYNVARALQLIAAGQAPADKVYVKGIVSNIESIDYTGYGNATYYISDTGYLLNQLEVYRGYSLGGDKFTSADELKEGDEVVVYGVILDYNGTAEFTSGSQIYSINGSTTASPSTPDTPTGDTATFRPATSITAGKAYIMVNAQGKVAIPIKESYTYGYLYVEDPQSVNGSDIVTSMTNAIVIAQAADGYTLTDSYGRLLSMDSEHASFQLYKSPEAGSYWTISLDGSKATITNVARGVTVYWAEKYSNFAPSTTEGDLPLLYEKID